MPIKCFYAFSEHGYSIDAVKHWRTEEANAGRPSTLDDFLQAHGLCVACRAAGRLIAGIHWQDSKGVEHRIELISPGVPESIASLHHRELKYSLQWDYTYINCEICGGTGKLV
jgi:hypothetical protein